MTDTFFSFTNNRITCKDDPKFIHMDDTIKILTYCLIRHIDSCLMVVRQQLSPENGSLYADMVSTYGLLGIDAGKLFNQTLAASPLGPTFYSSTEFTEAQYEAIVNTFVRCINENKRLAMIAKDIVDPYECMWEFCHYLFVPTRLMHDAIPKPIKMNSLKIWINLIFTLPFIQEYTSKLVSCMPAVEHIQSVYAKIRDDATKIKRMTEIDKDWCYNAIGEGKKGLNPLQTFIRTVMMVSLVASIEIVKKYCPCYRRCAQINPEYDGQWLNPVDPYYNEHLEALNKLLKLLAVSDTFNV